MTEEYDGSTELPGFRKDGRREQFCHEYVVDFNGTKAAMRAGYAEGSAGVTASRLLKDDKISLRVKYLAQKVRESVKVDAEYVLRELKLQYEADMTLIQDELGQVMDPKDWPEDVKKVIAGYDMTMVADKDGNTGGLLVGKLRRTDRLKALELMGKHKAVQAFQENIEVDAGDKLAEAIMAGRRRAKKENE